MNYSESWKMLMDLIGHPRSGEDTVVRLSWDDATGSALVRVGLGTNPQTYFGETMEQAVLHACRSRGIITVVDEDA